MALDSVFSDQVSLSFLFTKYDLSISHIYKRKKGVVPVLEELTP